jgi:hypothetical protein
MCRLEPVDALKQLSFHRREAADLVVVMARFIHDEQTRNAQLFVDIDSTTASV